MKPNFALNLSHDGISLLHRAANGWMRVGDVALDDPGLTEQLQVLRRTAADLENGGLTAKLVIPNSQILYTDVDAPGPDTASRIAQIRDGLVGLTPYDVNDLIFDWRMKGETAHVAVVARDTLREAENFAVEYRFNPVSFVAVPTGGQFDGEPYFGPTRHAGTLLQDGESIERDKERIKVIGGAESGKPRKKKAKPSDDAPKAETAPVADDWRDPATPVLVESAVDPSEAEDAPLPTPTQAPVAFTSRRRAHAVSAPVTSDPVHSVAQSVGSRSSGGGAAVASMALTDPERDEVEPTPVETAEVEVEAEPEAMPDKDDSIDRMEQADPATDKDVDGDVEPDELTDDDPDQPGGRFERLKSTRSPRPPLPKLKPRAKVGPISRKPDGSDRLRTAANSVGAVAGTGDTAPVGPATQTDIQRPPGRGARSALSESLGKLGRSTADSARKLKARAELRSTETRGTKKAKIAPLPAVDPAPAAKPSTDGATAKGAGGTAPIPAAPPANTPGPNGTGPAKPRAEAEAMTVFGARGRTAQRGKPRYLGLMLTLALLGALGVLALWSALFLDDVTASWFGTDDDPVAAAPPVLPQIDDPVVATTPEAPIDTVTLPEPVVPDAGDPETPPSPIDSAVADALAEDPVTEPPAPTEDVIAALPEPVETPVPETPDPEVAESPDPVVAPEAADIAETPDADPVTDGGTPELVVEAPETPVVEDPVVTEPATPDPVVAAPVRAPPPTPAEAEARYEATGIWELDPPPLGDAPGGGDRLDDVYVASIDPDISSVDAFALPGASGLTTDVLPPELTPPPPLGTTFDLDDRGLVRATPDGALTPEGVTVFSGSPTVVPGPRPPDLEVPVDETRLIETERLRGLRPLVRPADVSEGNQRARLGGRTEVELAALRPTLRPGTTDASSSGSDTETAALEEEEVETTRALPPASTLAAAAPPAPAAEETPDLAPEIAALAAIRPTLRPADLIAEAVANAAATERALPDATAEINDETATELAVVASFAPSTRPTDFSGVVRRALEEARATPARPVPSTPETSQPERVVTTAVVAPPRVPSIPTRASVANNATEKNAIPLNKVNLIGVYGSPTQRRALVRLASGRYVKVKVGDRVDGGKVSAIGSGELSYVKSGRSIVLRMPKG